MTKKVQITFDAADPHALIEWWADLLEYQVVDSHDFIGTLLEQGVITEADVIRRNDRLTFADGVAAEDPDKIGPRLYVQRVPEPKQAKNRLHLDVRIGQEGLDAEVTRLTAIGAQFVEWNSQPGHRWAVMLDPEGNEFCLT